MLANRTGIPITLSLVYMEISRRLDRVVLGIGFMLYGFKLWRDYSDELARRTFRFSILHLSLLFAALLVDHYVSPWLAAAPH